VGSFGADGLTVSIQNGAPETLASPLVVWNGTSFNLPDVAPGATTQVISTASQNPRGTFTGGAVFTSERDRLRGDVLRWLGEPVSGDNVSTAPLEQTPFLAAWVSDATVPSPLVIRPPVDTTRTLALLRVPLRIDPSPAGSTVRIGAAFSKLVFGPALVSLYNPIAGQWLDSNQDASLVVGFEAPAAVGRLRPTRVTIVGDLNAPRQTVTVVGDQVRDGRPVDNLAGRVLGTWTNPVTPQSVSFDVAPDDVDSTGRVWVRVDVKNPAPDGTPVSWRIVELAASFDEATVQ